MVIARIERFRDNYKRAGVEAAYFATRSSQKPYKIESLFVLHWGVRFLYFVSILLNELGQCGRRFGESTVGVNAVADDLG